MIAILANAAVGGWSIGDILIAVVVIAACAGILYAALQYFEVVIPPVVVKIFWICVIACVAILAIRFVLSL